MIILIVAAVLYVPQLGGVKQSVQNVFNTTSTQSQGGTSPPAPGATYLGINWQTVSGGGTPSSVTAIAYPVSSPSSYFNSGAMNAGTLYPSKSAVFPLTNGGYCEQLYSSSAYPAGYCITSGGTFTLPGFPGFQDSITPNSQCVGSSVTFNCISTSPTYPASYTNATTSVTAVTESLVPSFSGTTIPSGTFTLQLSLVGVAARGGGVGFDQAADGQVIGGVPNQPIQIYSNGNSNGQLQAGSTLQTQSADFVCVNQTSLGFNGIVNPSTNQLTTAGTGKLSSNLVYAGTSCWYIVIPSWAIYASSASSTPQYLFAQLTLSFTNNGITTGKHVFIVSGIVDNQQAVGFDAPNFLDNSGITSSEACTSSATTNGCVNSTDITVGTAQYTAGFPVAWGGGGSGSSTKPGWFTPTGSTNAGWGTFAPVMTMQTMTVVYGT